MAVCDGTCEPSCSYGCELRKKNVGITPSSMPSRMNAIPPRKHNPAWERGIITDKRPGGTEMPVFSPGTREPIGMHEYAQKRRSIEAQRKALRTRETPLPG